MAGEGGREAALTRSAVAPSERVGRVVYMARHVPKPPTQQEVLLDALSDHRWHSSLELYGLRMVVHSRIDGLRKAGHTIETRRLGRGAENFYYRLVPRPAAPAMVGRPTARVASASSPRGAVR